MKDRRTEDLACCVKIKQIYNSNLEQKNFNQNYYSTIELFIFWLQVGLGYSKKYGSEKIRVLTFYKNRGKGGAVRMVMKRY